MHSGMRSDIEKAIQIRMNEVLSPQGIDITAVLMKSIQLPVGLASSIEQKLQAEQEAMRMEFVLKTERLEAERKIIEANGTRDAQKILSEGLTDNILKLRSIEAFTELWWSRMVKPLTSLRIRDRVPKKSPAQGGAPEFWTNQRLSGVFNKIVLEHNGS
jgi:regulator of protease activity HflC (stomatin/prohibitin superfamily)